MFDMVAEDLKTLVYGLNGSTAVALAVDSSGNLNIGVGYTSANITVTDVATGSTGRSFHRGQAAGFANRRQFVLY
jgi:hypothetical protein